MHTILVLHDAAAALLDEVHRLFGGLGHLQQCPHNIHAEVVASQSDDGPWLSHDLRSQGEALFLAAIQERFCQNARREPVPGEALHVAPQRRHHQCLLRASAMRHHGCGELDTELVATQHSQVAREQLVDQGLRAFFAGGEEHQLAEQGAPRGMQHAMRCITLQLLGDERHLAAAQALHQRQQHLVCVWRESGLAHRTSELLRDHDRLVWSRKLKHSLQQRCSGGVHGQCNH
mmetsp:Transcript_107450/g.284737  ORF Transcript_107450/g.284737 Transcript_107450/m.284737 type:complete len:232 (+) Transcript_107450:365-1060(+)